MNFESSFTKENDQRGKFEAWTKRVAKAMTLLAMFQVGANNLGENKAQAGEIKVDNDINGDS